MNCYANIYTYWYDLKGYTPNQCFGCGSRSDLSIHHISGRSNRVSNCHILCPLCKESYRNSYMSWFESISSSYDYQIETVLSNIETLKSRLGISGVMSSEDESELQYLINSIQGKSSILS